MLHKFWVEAPWEGATWPAGETCKGLSAHLLPCKPIGAVKALDPADAIDRDGCRPHFSALSTRRIKAESASAAMGRIHGGTTSFAASEL